VHAFFPLQNGFFHNLVDFAPKLLQYLPRCGNGKVYSGAQQLKISISNAANNTAKGWK